MRLDNLNLGYLTTLLAALDGRVAREADSEAADTARQESAQQHGIVGSGEPSDSVKAQILLLSRLLAIDQFDMSSELAARLQGSVDRGDELSADPKLQPQETAGIPRSGHSRSGHSPLLRAALATILMGLGEPVDQKTIDLAQLVLDSWMHARDNSQPAVGVPNTGSARLEPILDPMSSLTGAAGVVDPAPGQATPEQAAPGQATPEQATPGQVTPEQAVSGQATPGQVASASPVSLGAIPNQKLLEAAILARLALILLDGRLSSETFRLLQQAIQNPPDRRATTAQQSGPAPAEGNLPGRPADSPRPQSETPPTGVVENNARPSLTPEPAAVPGSPMRASQANGPVFRLVCLLADTRTALDTVGSQPSQAGDSAQSGGQQPPAMQADMPPDLETASGANETRRSSEAPNMDKMSQTSGARQPAETPQTSEARQVAETPQTDRILQQGKTVQPNDIRPDSSSSQPPHGDSVSTERVPADRPVPRSSEGTVGRPIEDNTTPRQVHQNSNVAPDTPARTPEYSQAKSLENLQTRVPENAQARTPENSQARALENTPTRTPEVTPTSETNSLLAMNLRESSPIPRLLSLRADGSVPLFMEAVIKTRSGKRNIAVVIDRGQDSQPETPSQPIGVHLSLQTDNLGPMAADLVYGQGVSCTLAAGRDAIELVKAGLPMLRQNLIDSGLRVLSVSCQRAAVMEAVCDTPDDDKVVGTDQDLSRRGPIGSVRQVDTRA